MIYHKAFCKAFPVCSFGYKLKTVTNSHLLQRPLRDTKKKRGRRANERVFYKSYYENSHNGCHDRRPIGSQVNQLLQPPSLEYYCESITPRRPRSPAQYASSFVSSVHELEHLISARVGNKELTTPYFDASHHVLKSIIRRASWADSGSILIRL